jgi:serine/threonine protein kinase
MHDPSTPIHPALVRTHLPDSPSAQDFFFKPVDPTQPSPTKREITLLHKIHRLRLDHQINVPRLHALVSAPPLNGASTTSIMGLLLTPNPTPVTPLTVHLTPSSLSASERQFYATEVQRTIEILHAHDIVYGDAKADNFLVDKDGKLWIIDFGGSYTEGWVEPELEETREGDLQGIEKIVEGLVEDEEEDNGDGGRQGEEGDGTDIEEDTKRARGKRKIGNVDDSTKEGYEKTEKKVKR